MKYFIDQEFSEGFKLGWNLRYYHTIELIQIGIVAEDGRTYTAINKNFNPKKANQWVKDNVLKAIVLNYVNTRFGQELIDLTEDLENKTIEQSFKFLQRRIGKTQKQIASEVFDFINPDLGFPVSAYTNSEFKNPDSYISKHFKAHNVTDVKEYYYAQPEFYGYFCDYDWVLFCSLFGTMMDLPPGFPMYMRDLKQTLDEVAKRLGKNGKANNVYIEDPVQLLKEHKDYPKPTVEHDALADAQFNFELYKFLKPYATN